VDWYADNDWRLPDSLRAKPAAARAFVDAACRNEAEARLRALNGR
jgi:hypothetical protein